MVACDKVRAWTMLGGKQKRRTQAPKALANLRYYVQNGEPRNRLRKSGNCIKGWPAARAFI